MTTTLGTLVLSKISRYKDTPVYSTGGVLEFGLWSPPLEFTSLPLGSTVHQVRSNEIGMLDMLAAKYFGPGYESMWWAIAQANNIIEPDIDMYAGQILVIPPRTIFVAFQGRTSNAG